MSFFNINNPKFHIDFRHDPVSVSGNNVTVPVSINGVNIEIFIMDNFVIGPIYNYDRFLLSFINNTLSGQNTGTITFTGGTHPIVLHGTACNNISNFSNVIANFAIKSITVNGITTNVTPDGGYNSAFYLFVNSINEQFGTSYNNASTALEGFNESIAWANAVNYIDDGSQDITWYSMTLYSTTNNIILDTYITVQNKIITNIYDRSLPLGDSYQNILLPAKDPFVGGTGDPNSDNQFPISGSGINFESNSLQTIFQTSYNVFNLYADGEILNDPNTPIKPTVFNIILPPNTQPTQPTTLAPTTLAPTTLAPFITFNHSEYFGTIINLKVKSSSVSYNSILNLTLASDGIDNYLLYDNYTFTWGLTDSIGNFINSLSPNQSVQIIINGGTYPITLNGVFGSITIASGGNSAIAIKSYVVNGVTTTINNNLNSILTATLNTNFGVSLPTNNSITNGSNEVTAWSTLTDLYSTPLPLITLADSSDYGTIIYLKVKSSSVSYNSILNLTLASDGTDNRITYDNYTFTSTDGVIFTFITTLSANQSVQIIINGGKYPITLNGVYGSITTASGNTDAIAIKSYVINGVTTTINNNLNSILTATLNTNFGVSLPNTSITNGLNEDTAWSSLTTLYSTPLPFITFNHSGYYGTSINLKVKSSSVSYNSILNLTLTSDGTDNRITYDNYTLTSSNDVIFTFITTLYPNQSVQIIINGGKYPIILNGVFGSIKTAIGGNSAIAIKSYVINGVTTTINNNLNNILSNTFNTNFGVSLPTNNSITNGLNEDTAWSSLTALYSTPIPPTTLGPTTSTTLAPTTLAPTTIAPLITGDIIGTSGTVIYLKVKSSSVSYNSILNLTLASDGTNNYLLCDNYTLSWGLTDSIGIFMQGLSPNQSVQIIINGGTYPIILNGVYGSITTASGPDFSIAIKSYVVNGVTTTINNNLNSILTVTFNTNFGVSLPTNNSITNGSNEATAWSSLTALYSTPIPPTTLSPTLIWYSTTIYSNNELIFDGYFTVQNNIIQEIYDKSLPLDNGYEGVILPMNDSLSYENSDNVFPINANGVNFYSTALQNFFSATDNHFNLWLNNSEFILDGGGSVTVDFTIVPEPFTPLPPTLAPTTLAPTTLAPTTLAPTTLAPTTLAPTTLAPTTLAPFIAFNHYGSYGTAIFLKVKTSSVSYNSILNLTLTSDGTDNYLVYDNYTLSWGSYDSIGNFINSLSLNQSVQIIINGGTYPITLNGVFGSIKTAAGSNNAIAIKSYVINGITTTVNNNLNSILTATLNTIFGVSLPTNASITNGLNEDTAWSTLTDLYSTPIPSTTLAPTTLAPTTLAPTTLAPTTLAPTTLAPTTLAPTTLAPTTLAPTTLAPTTLAPTTLAPTTLILTYTFPNFTFDQLPVSGTIISIDWGDGTIDTVNRTHTYTAGTYIVKFTGYNFSMNHQGKPCAYYLTSCSSIGDITNFSNAFYGCSQLTSVPTITYATNMSYMFSEAIEFNQNISSWTVNNVTDMSGMFQNARSFNQPLNWDVSQVTNMSAMFYGASSFNQPLNWTVSQVTNMYRMFNSATSFNQPLNWNVENVTTMREMFQTARLFNQPLNWNVSQVTNMAGMFYEAYLFNQSLNWNVENVTTMRGMFNNATVFNQNISGWNVIKVTDMNNMFNYSGLSVYTYDSMLLNGLFQNLKKPITVGVSNIYYKDTYYRQLLINSGVTLVGDIMQYTLPENTPAPIILTYDFRGFLSISSPLPVSGTITAIDWGDGIINTGQNTHTYSSVNIYTLTFYGTNLLINHKNNTYARYLLSCTSIGNVTNFSNAFYGCEQLTSVPTITYATNMSYMFNGTHLFNQNISDWDVSQVTNMSGMFYNAIKFNQPLQWNVSNVTDMSLMFYNAYMFNQPLQWNVTNVTDMNYMFYQVSNFNQPLNFITTNLKNTSGMFYQATSFNQPLNWDVTNVTDMSAMFSSARSFNQPLNWNVTNLKTTSSMFSSAISFNQPLNWNVTNVTNMAAMFNGASLFDQPLNWDVRNVTDMSYMFQSANSFNQPLNWDVTKLKTTFSMFSGAIKFNQPLPWNVANVTNMGSMFQSATVFNFDISGWNVIKVTNMLNMFNYSGLSVYTYDSMLLNGLFQNLKKPITVGVSNIYYKDTYYRQLLINSGVSLFGDGLQPTTTLAPTTLPPTPLSFDLNDNIVVYSNKLYGYGKNYNENLGLIDYTNFLFTQMTIPSGTIKQVVATAVNIYILMTDNTVWGIGNNNDNQLGYIGKPTNSFIKIFSSDSIISIGGCDKYISSDTSQRGNFYIMTNTAIYSFGNNASGNLGIGNTGSVSSPIQQMILPLNKTPAEMSVGNRFIVVRMTDNTLYGCGNNSNGQLTGTTNPVTSLTLMTLTVTPIKISCGFANTAVLMSDGTVWACGSNSNYQINNTNTNNVTTFTNIYTGASSISVGYNNIIISKDNKLYGRGANESNQLTNTTSNITSVTLLNTFSDPITTIYSNNSCTIVKTSTTYVRGKNENSQLGLNQTKNISSFTSIPLNVTQIDSAYKYTIVVSQNKLYLSGLNPLYSYLVNQLVEIPMNFTDTILSIKGSYTNIIVKTQNGYYGCGNNSYGQLYGVIGDAKKLTKLNIDSSLVKDVYVGNSNIMILYKDGTLKACGSNNNGMLNIESTNYVTTLTNVAIPEGYSVVDIELDNNKYSSFLLNDGTTNSVWSCGSNNGQFGNGITGPVTTTLTQMPMPSGLTPSKISSCNSNIAVLMTNGTLWGCGNNYYAQLQGSRTTVPSLRQYTLPSTYSVRKFKMANDMFVLLDTNNSLWMVGLTDYFFSSTFTSGFQYISVPFQIKDFSCTQSAILVSNYDNDVYVIGKIGNISFKTLTYVYKSDVLMNSTEIVTSPTVDPLGPVIATTGSLYNDGSFSDAISYISNNRLYVRGRNQTELLGVGDKYSNTLQPFPYALPTGYTGGQITQLIHNTGTVYTLMSDNTIWGVGLNHNNQLNTGNTGLTFYDTFQKITLPTGQIPSVIGTGGDFLTIGMTGSTGGKVYTCGFASYVINGYGTSKALSAITGPTGYTITNIACGLNHAVYTLQNIATNVKTLYAIGDNSNGILGIGSTTQATAQTLIAMSTFPTKTPLKVACGDNHTVVLMTDGTVYACGKNDRKQINNTTTPITSFTQLTTTPGITVVDVEAGGSSTIFVYRNADNTYSITGIGDNTYGKLTGTTNPVITEQSLSFTPSITITTQPKISCSANHITVLIDETLYTAGYNLHGQLNNSTFINSNTLTENGTNITQCIAYGNHTIVKKTNGLYHCGDALGKYTSAPETQVIIKDETNTPVNIVKHVMCSAYGFVLTDTYDVYCCGTPSNNVFDTTTPLTRYTKMNIALFPDENIIDIFCGSKHVILLTNKNNLYGRGNNGNFQLGGLNTSNITAFTLLNFYVNEKIKQIVCNQDYTLIMTENNIYGVGNNIYGNLGIGTYKACSSFSKMILPAGRTPKKIASSMASTVVLMDDGSLYGCGLNDLNQLIPNTTTYYYSTLQNLTITNVLDINFTIKQLCYITKDNKIYINGYFFTGSVSGITVSNNRTSAQLPSIGKTFKNMIGNHAYNTYVRMTDNTIYGEGINQYNALSKNTMIGGFSNLYNPVGLFLTSDIGNLTDYTPTPTAQTNYTPISFTNQSVITFIYNFPAMFFYTLPVSGGIIHVNWDNIVDFNNKTYLFQTAGTYTVSITGYNLYINHTSNTSAKYLTSCTSIGDVVDFSYAFYGCTQLTSVPTITYATNMKYMFSGASSFNQNISEWVVSEVTNMSGMFQNANAFNQPLNWNVAKVTDMTYMFTNSGLSVSTYNAILSWLATTLQKPITIGVSPLTYTNKNSHDILTTSGVILDDTFAIQIITFIYTFPTSFLFDSLPVSGSITSINWNNTEDTVNRTYTYSAGTYTVKFTGTNLSINHQGKPCAQYLTSCTSTGNVVDFSNAFKGCSQLTSVPTIAHATNMAYMFSDASSFNQNISGWNVSWVTNMSGMFQNASTFNQNISGWNVSKVTDMSNIFDYSGLSISTYDEMLSNGLFQNLQPIIVGVSNLQCTNTYDRQLLINSGVTLVGDIPPTTLPPTTLAPTTLPPTTLPPTTLPPTTLAPTTLAPTTLAPTTLAPTTLAPTTLPPTLAPTTLAPTTLPPTTLAPTTLAPTTLAPTTLAPTTLAPTTLPPTTLAPTTQSTITFIDGNPIIVNPITSNIELSRIESYLQGNNLPVQTHVKILNLSSTVFTNVDMEIFNQITQIYAISSPPNSILTLNNFSYSPTTLFILATNNNSIRLTDVNEATILSNGTETLFNGTKFELGDIKIIGRYRIQLVGNASSAIIITETPPTTLTPTTLPPTRRQSYFILNALATEAYTSLGSSTISPITLFATYTISLSQANSLQSNSETAFGITSNIFANAIVKSNPLNTSLYRDNIIADYIKNIDSANGTTTFNNPNYVSKSTNSKSLAQDCFNVGYFFAKNVFTGEQVSMALDDEYAGFNKSFMVGDTIAVPVTLYSYSPLKIIDRSYIIEFVVSTTQVNYPTLVINGKTRWSNNSRLFNHDLTSNEAVFGVSQEYPSQNPTNATMNSLANLKGNKIRGNEYQSSSYDARLNLQRNTVGTNY